MIVRYVEKLKNEWDMFVLCESINGNFLQTRNYLNYHPKGQFIDHSLLIYKDTNMIAVFPANEVNHGKGIISHEGSTFGGIIIGEKFASITNYLFIFEELKKYFILNGLNHIEIRMPHWLYSRSNHHYEILDYFFHTNGYSERLEVGFYIDLDTIEENYENNFGALRRRKLKKALSNDMEFRELFSDKDIMSFYKVLENNMQKFNTQPLHTYDNMIDFKNNRIQNEISFYGVFYQEEMIAGSMVFNFCEGKVFHTQYLASKQEKLDLCPNEFLYTNLIKEAKKKKNKFLSYGTSTLQHGSVFNMSLALYKEGYHTETYVNRTYVLDL